MNTATTPELHEIIAAGCHRPAVSLILPFEPEMNKKDELALRLRVAVEKVQRELEDNYPAETVELVMNRLKTLIGNLNFNTHKKSVAVYVSPVFEKVLYLEMPVMEKIMIGDSFEIRDLVYNKKRLRKYLVLVLGGKQSRIFLGNTESLVEIESSTPGSVYAYVNEVPEKVANFSDASSRKETVMDKFLRNIDKALDTTLNAYQLPLFVIGNERMCGHFKGLTRHANAIVQYIHGNNEDASEEQLMTVMEPHTEGWESVIQKDLLNQLEDARGKKKLAMGMREVWQEAMNRQGRLLIVEKDYMQGPKEAKSKVASFNPEKTYNKYSNVKDAVDDVMEIVLENGGNVEFVNNDMLKEYDRIALIKYY